jgi:hypothetical protein
MNGWKTSSNIEVLFKDEKLMIGRINLSPTRPINKRKSIMSKNIKMKTIISKGNMIKQKM